MKQKKAMVSYVDQGNGIQLKKKTSIESMFCFESEGWTLPWKSQPAYYTGTNWK